MITFESLQKYNQTVSEHAKRSRQMLLFAIASLDLKSTAEVHENLRLRNVRNIKVVAKKEGGQVESINYKFPYQGWFVETGTRKGIPLGSSEAVPRVWLVPTINDTATQLADALIEILGDEVFKAFKVNLN